MEAPDFSKFLSLDIPEVSYLLHPTIPRQGLVMLYAATGVGKTHLSLSMAYAVAVGGEVLGWNAPVARKVLYVDGEMSGADMKTRLRALSNTYGRAPGRGYFRIANPDIQDDYTMPDIGLEEGREAVDRQVLDADLVVLDNLSTLCRSLNENDGSSAVGLIGWVMKLRASGKSVLLVHHAGKSGDQRGTTRKLDALNTVIKLTHPPDYHQSHGCRFLLDFEKSRGVYGHDVASFEAAMTLTDRYIWEKSDVYEQKRATKEENLLNALSQMIQGK